MTRPACALCGHALRPLAGACPDALCARLGRLLVLARLELALHEPPADAATQKSP